MKKSTKIVLSLIGFGLLTVGLTSCTTSFCSPEDRTRVAYTYDVYQKTVKETIEEKEVTRKIENTYVYGISTFWDNENPDKPTYAVPLTYKINGVEYVSTTVSVTYDIADNLFLTEINNTAKGSSYNIKVDDYTLFWGKMDYLSLNEALSAWDKLEVETKNAYFDNGTSKPLTDLNKVELRNILVGHTRKSDNKPFPGYGYLKYLNNPQSEKKELWENWMSYYDTIRLELGADYVPGVDYISLLKTQYNTKMNSTNSCIATKEGFYGYYGYNADNKTEVYITVKDWNYAWHLHNFPLLEGVFVFPISWLIDTISNGIMGVGNGTAQLLAILIVTFIVRGLMLLITFKSTTNQARMQEVQPEIAKIQAKYPNANTNNAERNALAQETNALYKKHNIHPFSSLLVMFVQFPVFICVWGAMQGSAILSSGSFCGLYLSESVSSVLFNVNGWPNIPGWWTALVMFLIMAALQVFSMLLPQIIQKKKAKKAVAATGKNANVAKQNSTMKWFTIIMMVMVIIMGFSLASGMVVYWIAGSLFSIAQTLLTEYINNHKNTKKKEKKKVVKATSDGAVVDAEVTDAPSVYVPTGKKKYKDRGNK